MIKGVNTTILSKDHQPVESMKNFIKKTTGAKLTPVARTDNAFWISGDKRGNYYEQKYYKIVFGPVTQVSYRPNRSEKSGYGFDIQSSGDYMGWSLMGEYRKMIKEAVDAYKEASA